MAINCFSQKWANICLLRPTNKFIVQLTVTEKL